MKQGILKMAVVLFCAGMCLLTYSSLAQEEEELEYSWGTVKSVSSGEIVVTEYDYETDTEVDVTYTLDPNVKLLNVNSIDEIKAGDSVDIEYLVKDDQKIIKTITVEKYLEEEFQPEKGETQL